MEEHLGYATLDRDGAISLSSMADAREAKRALTKMQYWNRIHAQMRSRVERRHAHLLKWRFLQFNAYQLDGLETAVATIVSLEAFIRGLLRYSDLLC